MQIQVVCCHPLTDSYDHALFRTVVSTLEQNGHGVAATDLYREGFAPAMTVEERRTYGPQSRPIAGNQPAPPAFVLPRRPSCGASA